MGGGSTIRAAVRAVGAGAGGVQGALPVSAGGAARHGRPPSVVSVSASASSGSSPSCAALMAERGGGQWHPPHPCFCEEHGLDSAGEREAEGDDGRGFAEWFVFGPVPSREEVVEAVTAIQQTLLPFPSPQHSLDRLSSTSRKDIIDETVITDPLHRVPSTEQINVDWIEPARQFYDENSIQYQAYDKVIDAFRLLQTNPSIQRTVFSLSSDKAVWDAVMKNEAVKELRESIYPAEVGNSPSPGDGHNVLARLLKWVIGFTRAKVIELVSKIAQIVNELFLHHEKDEVGEMDLLEDALRSSFMLSIMVFILVIITRIQKALQ